MANSIDTSGGFDMKNGGTLVVRAIETKDGSFVVPTPELIRDTTKRYKLALHALRTNTEVDENLVPEMPEPINSDEYMVQIFNNSVLINLGEFGEFKIKAHIFGETTHPQHYVDLMRIMMKGLWLADELPEHTVSNNNTLAHTAQEFTDHAAANGGKVDLAQQFPHAPQANTNNKPATPKAANTTNAAIIEEFDYNAVTEYEQQYSGQTVGVKIGRIQHAVEAKKDKSGFYEIYAFTPFYNGDLSKFAPFALNQFVPEPGKANYDYAIFKQLRELLPQAGAMVEGDMTVYFKINPAKSGDKVYWNITKIMHTHPNGQVHDFPFDIDLRAQSALENELSEDELDKVMKSQSEIPF